MVTLQEKGPVEPRVGKPGWMMTEEEQGSEKVRVVKVR